MKAQANRIALIVVCALFNLSFEYSARGIAELITRPGFTLALFGIYLTYFAMLEDLMVRFRLTNRELFLAAFLYGLFPIAFFTRNLFNPDIYKGIMVLGVNLGTLTIVGILAWGVVQGVITLYLANRIWARDWDHPRMGVIGWILALGYQVTIIVYAHANPNAPRATPMGYVVFGVLVVVSAILLTRSLSGPRPQPPPFQRSVVMDLLAVGSLLLFLVLGTLFVSKEKIVTSQPLNLLAVTLENWWTILCGLVFFVYRALRRSDVAV